MDDKVEDLLRRRTELVAGGGETKVEGQYRKGKKTARERIDAFLDPGSFVEIDAACDPVAMRCQKIEEYRQLFANPYEAVARGFIDDVIEQRFTRSRLIDALVMLTVKSEERPAKKHGNIPL